MAVAQGDIAFVAYSGGNNGVGNTGFAFVLLAPLTEGDTITFTDRNWNGTSFRCRRGLADLASSRRRACRRVR